MTFDLSLPSEELAEFVRKYAGLRLPEALRYANAHQFRIAPHDRFDNLLYANSDFIGRRITTSIPLSASSSSGFSSSHHQYCDCWSPSCIHAEAALVQYVLTHRPEVRPLIEEIAEDIATISESGHAVLSLLQRASTVKSTPSVARGEAIHSESDRVFFYALNIGDTSISVLSTKRLKNGAYSKTLKVERNWSAALDRDRDSWPGIYRPTVFDDVGVRLARELFLAGVNLPKSGDLLLKSLDMALVLPLIAATGRLLGPDRDLDRPLRIGEPATMSAEWQALQHNRWRIDVKVAGRLGSSILRTTPPWYFDADNRVIGPISNDLSPVVLELAFGRLSLPASDLPLIQKALSRLPQIEDLPTLPTIETVDRDDVPPLPVLTLTHSERNGCVEAVVSFEYEKQKVTGPAGDWLITFEPGKQLRIKRQHGAETAMISDLEAALPKQHRPSGSWNFIISSEYDPDDVSYISKALSFQREVVPRLRKQGWEIVYDASFDLHLIEDVPWELSIQDDRHGWYNVRLEVFRDGRPIDLLSVLRSLLKNPQFIDDVMSDSHGHNPYWWSRVSATEYMEVPVDEVRRLARLLLDLGQFGESAGNELKISRFDVDFLNSASRSEKIVVSGADQLISLASSLAVQPPPLDEGTLGDFVLPLREYQKEGVAWLQWRLQHEVGAVLGDEMAVGKTIQALAHMWIESLSDGKPASLIVVQPTLLSKWLSEKDKFLPKMKIGLYHGPNRRGSLPTLMATNEAVLTTYRTLVLDIVEFFEQQWHIVACDEGHELRNPDTDMARAIAGLQAKQKIVISGTPIQNKLLDLWTVMNIAVPGLLRDQKWFKRRFVQDIERTEELGPHRRRLLGQITAPFRLSRKNKEVGNALPPVNTSYRYVDMGDEQAKVYETMRATMDADVRALIAESGLSRNQISILAAIGRLRQICCHPALAKSDAIPADVPSAKLDYLLDMIDELHSDGRAVVVVSQWVEMLKIISQKLDEKRVGHRMLVGKGMSLKRREEALAAFRHGRAACLLMSLAVGGVGLDIPEGDDIIIFDPWWNPKRVEQAIARLTRDDRDKRINAHYLVAKGTLEEGVLKIAERKGEMIASVLESGAGSDAALDLADIDMLFTPVSLGG